MRTRLAPGFATNSAMSRSRPSLSAPRTLLLPALLALVLGAPSLPGEEASSRRETAELRARGGVPNLLRKVRAADGREIRVAYLGGSITAAPGWRVKSLKGFRARYPATKWTEIHAAIGGTGSDLGVFRLGQDVLAHRPDLLFVEFAVNDGGADPAQIHRAMEGIVRQTWTADPETDIVFVYTVSEPVLEELRAGKCSRSATAMEELADHYGIPSVHFGVEVAKRLAAGTLVFKGEKSGEASKDAAPDPAAPMVFSTDGVHPLVETGHVLYAEALARAWDELDRAEPSPAPHALVEPLRRDHWAAAKLIPVEPAMLSGEWTRLDGSEGGDELARRFAKFLPQMWRTETPGSSLRFRFRGEFVGVFDLVGPDGGRLRASIDEGGEMAVARFDSYCTYHRLSKFRIGGDLDPAKIHAATLVLDETAPDKRSVLFERNRHDFDKNPDKYAPNRWHLGAIMLIGELVD